MIKGRENVCNERKSMIKNNDKHETVDHFIVTQIPNV